MLILTFMDMPIRKVVFCLEIQFLTLVFKLRVFYSPSIYPQSVNLFSLKLVISAKNKWPPRIKEKIFLSKVVQELLFISGQTLHIAILWKPDYIKMLKLMIRE